MVEMTSTVTAIISAYNSERWLRGRLDNLLDQTLYATGRLDLIVVIAGSREYETRIVRDYLRQGARLQLIVSLRESIYRSWNRALRLSTAGFVVNANCDDRLAPHALERLAGALDAHPDVGLVYADAYVTDTVNGTWDSFHPTTNPPYPSGTIRWPDFDPALLTRQYVGGPNPMWRRSLHAEHGPFDESYQLAGDYEFALRLVSRGVQFQHLPELLTLYYDGGASIRHQDLTASESRRALLRWGGHLTHAQVSS